MRCGGPVVTIAIYRYGDKYPVTNEGRIIGPSLSSPVWSFQRLQPVTWQTHSSIAGNAGPPGHAVPTPKQMDPLDAIRQILEEQGKLLASIEKRLPPTPESRVDAAHDADASQ